MEKNFFKKFFLPFLSVALIAVIALAGCGGNGEGPANVGNGNGGEAIHTADAVDIGTGETVFRFEKVDGDDNLFAWNVHTNEETVGAALLEVGLVAGDETAFGLMVTTVNGLTADFSADGSWWRFDIDGAMAPAGVSDTYIEEGVTYAFVFSRG